MIIINKTLNFKTLISFALVELETVTVLIVITRRYNPNAVFFSKSGSFQHFNTLQVLYQKQGLLLHYKLISF